MYNTSQSNGLWYSEDELYYCKHILRWYFIINCRYSCTHNPHCNYIWRPFSQLCLFSNSDCIKHAFTIHQFNAPQLSDVYTKKKFSCFSLLNVSGGGISHSLSWHKKGDRIPGCKLYARVWTPEDPRAVRGLAGPSYPTGSHTGLDIWIQSFYFYFIYCLLFKIIYHYTSHFTETVNSLHITYTHCTV